MPTEFQSGQIIGSWELVRPLGVGAFGEVWLARHTELGHELALKIPTDPEFVRQLRMEGRLQFNLRHPNIVVTHDLNTRGTPPFVAMEFVEGRNLREHLQKKGKLPVEEALGILKQILGAVAYAHSQGILHRDLKPENILLATDGTVKVTDFGLGRVQEEVTRSMVLSGSMSTASGHSISGTFEYMSPEQRKASPASAKDDVFALGVIACELLVGERPGGVGLAKTLSRRGVRAELTEVIEKACEDPDFRYADAGKFLEALRDLVPSTWPLPPPVSTPSRARVQASKERPFKNSLGMQFVPTGTSGVLFSVWETRLKDYTVFAQVTNRSWERPNFNQGEDHPVVNVSWVDAKAFCAWLTEKERKEGVLDAGQEYRLPMDAEWSVAVGDKKYPWGDEWPPSKGAGNYDSSLKVDDFKHTSPVGSFSPNRHGLYDMGGNVWEWCEDGEGKSRWVRGGSWGLSDSASLASSCRNYARLTCRYDRYGFRCVLVMQK